jgi:hypothetical protein
VDTREKIVQLETLPALLSIGEWSAIAGLFDPLTLVQAERLASIALAGRRLAVIVIPDDRALLSSHARATLIAALREVDAVSIAEPEQLNRICSELPSVHVYYDKQAERLRSAEFIELVRQRQKSVEALK